MRKILSLALSTLLLFSSIFGSQNLRAQDNKDPGVFLPTTPTRPSEVNLGCETPRPQPACNFILNNTFNLSQGYNPAGPEGADQFNHLFVQEWRASHGTPQAYDGVNYVSPLPFPGAGYARMASFYQFGPYGTGGEGIIQKIPILRTGDNYILSFFRKADASYPEYPPQRLKIVLARCDISDHFNPPDYTAPTLPFAPETQVIYCEDGFTNTGWEQVVVNFTAKSDYDMVMIFSEHTSIQGSLGIMLLSFPELVRTISAGPMPNPTPGNCVVTIGPSTPNCGVRNAVFTWYGPNGLTIPAPPSQQIQINTADPLYVGNWTLKMTVPGVTITNSVCSQQGAVSASVYVPPCSGIITPQWPKIYEAAESEHLKIDNNGNIFYLMYLQDMLNNINHIGATTSNTGDYYIHYNKTTGLTNWISSDWGLYYTLSSGAANFYNNPQGNIYLDGATGNAVPGPTYVPAIDKILAEDNGAFITQTGYNGWGLSLTLNSYSPTSAVPVSSFSTPSIPGYMQEPFAGNGNAIYNPANQKLYVGHYYWNGAQGHIYRLAIYHLDPVTYVLTPLNNPANNPLNGPIVQVNSSEKIFVYNVGSQSLEEYDLSTGLPTTLVINNFANNSLETLGHSNQTLDDRILIKNTNQNYFYYINTSVPYTATKIQYTPPSTMSQFYSSYVFDGNEVFIAGEYMGTGFTIGNQTFPLLGSSSAFLTKFNVSTDFNRSGGGFFAKGNDDNIAPANSPEKTALVNNGLQLFPNPVNQSLQVALNMTPGKEASMHFISITNAAGIKVLTTFSRKNITELDVSQLKPGIYYLSIITDKKIIATKAFLKN